MSAPGSGIPSQGDAVAPRPDLGLVEGYHSPQLDVAYRMNTNEAPEAPPAEFLAAVIDELGELTLNRYPDRDALELRAAIGEFHGVAPEAVYCANGSNEVLQSLLLAYGGPGRVVTTFEPTYALHSHIARVTGTEVMSGQRDEQFLIERAEVESLFEKVSRVGEGMPVLSFLCSPNNPTGRLEPRATVEFVLEHAPGLVVVDEAYGQFAPWSALELRDRFPRLVVVRTFSKIWSLAGLRLGYAIADPDVVRALESVTLPYHLDSIKQVAGRVALEFSQQMRERVARITEERGRLQAALGDLDVSYFPSDANFILFRPGHRDAKALWQTLVDQASVLVRDVSSSPYLEGYLRVTVGTRAENDAFLAALADALS